MGCAQAGRQCQPNDEEEVRTTGAPRPKPQYVSEDEERAAEKRRDCIEGMLVHKSFNSSSEPHYESTCSNVKVVNSQAMFSKADQTIIIFDWDDTICPSSALRRYARFDRQGKLLAKIDDEVLERLRQLQEQAKALLEMASELGKVVLVTNAKKPWVEISCNAFMPALLDIMKTIPIIYAIELLSQGPPPHVPEGDLSGSAILTETKTRAMRAAVTEFYSRYPNQSWKNIVSIGDALFEHHAIRQVVGEHMRTNAAPKRCRTKTLKLLDGPTVSGLAIQLRIVYMWLGKVVQADDDVDIDFSADEAAINHWRAVFSSEADFITEGHVEPP